MKYFILALLVVSAVAEDEVEITIEDAAFSMKNFPKMDLQRMGYAAFGDPSNQMFIPKPPQKAIDHFNSLRDEDFPVDYSMRCSNTCGCRQTCIVMWWVPCSCMCPPQCPTTTEAPTTIPQRPWQPAPPQIPWVPAPPSVPGPEPIPPQNNRPWQPAPPQNPWAPEPIPPQNNRPWQPAPPPQNPWAPEPIPPQNNRPWQPAPPPQNPQNPSFPNINNNQRPWQTTTQGPLTHPPQPFPTSLPCNRQPGPPLTHAPWNPQPIWPQPQPEPEPQWPWVQAPQQPQDEPPQWPWVQAPEPEPQWPWVQAPQQPQNDCSACNNQCSCTPCSVIWVCPPPCPASCCNGSCGRHFSDAENYQDVQDVNEAMTGDSKSNKIAFQSIPQYLWDIFNPELI